MFCLSSCGGVFGCLGFVVDSRSGLDHVMVGKDGAYQNLELGAFAFLIDDHVVVLEFS